MINLVDFKPEHMTSIKRDSPDGDMIHFCGDITKRSEAYAKAGPAITLLDGDEVLAIGGVIKFWQGVGEAWMVVSPEGRKRIMSLYKYMDAFLRACFNKYGFHRIQANILQDFETAHRCIMKLDFIPEGMMIQYGPNKENFIRYVRFK